MTEQEIKKFDDMWVKKIKNKCKLRGALVLSRARGTRVEGFK